MLLERRRMGPIHRGPTMTDGRTSARQKKKNIQNVAEAWGVMKRPLMSECIEHTPREDDGGEVMASDGER